MVSDRCSGRSVVETDLSGSFALGTGREGRRPARSGPGVRSPARVQRAAGDPEPGRAEHRERGLVQQVGHGQALHAPGDGVPGAPDAPSRPSKPPSRKAWTACSWTAARSRVRPETCAAHEASCMAEAHGRCSARPSSTAARHAARPASSRSRTDARKSRRSARGRRPAGAENGPRSVTRSKAAVSSRRTRGEDPGRPVADRGVGEHVGGLVQQVGVEGRHGRVLGAEDVVAEQPLEGRGVADRALLEPGDQDGGAVARNAGAASRTCGTAAAISRARRDRTARTPRCSRSRPRRGGRRRWRERSVGVGGETGEQDLGDSSAGGQPHQVEAERGGTDQ